MNGAQPSAGNMFELDAIAACFIGGVSTTGGIGRLCLSGLMRGVRTWRGEKFLLPKNVPVAAHLSSAELQPLGKFE